MRLGLEIAVARAAGRLSRLAGRGGGTTLPGKILATVDPDAVGTLAGRLPLGSALLSATNGTTTTNYLNLSGSNVAVTVGEEIVSAMAVLLANAAGATCVGRRKGKAWCPGPQVQNLDSSQRPAGHKLHP